LADEDEPDEELPATPAERAVIDAAESWEDYMGTEDVWLDQSDRKLRDAVARLRSERNKNDAEPACTACGGTGWKKLFDHPLEFVQCDCRLGSERNKT